MACIQYPRKERGGVSLGSWEQPIIYKEPLKEVFTKKKERIEEGDITHLIRNDPSRINDAITNWQKGVNMMVEVDYQNRAPHTTTMNFGSASNPYKINKSFRPPEFNLLDLQPLSRQQRPYVAAQTNNGSQVTRNDFSAIRMDQSEVDFSIGNPEHYEANANVAREVGVYHDNFVYKDMVNEEYVTKQVLSQLKGMESVELQKFFQYENTPNGIVLTPLSFSAISSTSGPSDTSSQHYIPEAHTSIQDVIQIAQGTNRVGEFTRTDHMGVPTNVYIHEDGGIHYSLTSNQRGQSSISNSHLDAKDFVTDRLQVGQGTNAQGNTFVDAQSYIQGIQNYIDAPLQIGQGTNFQGNLVTDSQRNLAGIDDYTRNQMAIGVGTNFQGNTIDSQRNLAGIDDYTRNQMAIGVGTNQKAAIAIQMEQDHQAQMKDILLKNMTTSVSIVIQQPSGLEQPIQGTIQDKISIVVHSSKGQPITLSRENGEPIHLKDYTWKFVKSASGSDKFIIQADQPELELDRKATLYSVSSNPGQNLIQPESEEVNLRREVRNTSAVTNVGIQGDLARVDESFMHRVEKQTHYTDHQIASNPVQMERTSLPPSIHSIESSKKQHNQNHLLKLSEGRF